MHDKLKEIIAAKEAEVARLKADGMPSSPLAPAAPLRDFKGAIAAPGGVRLIAEIKFASPSAGILREISDPRPLGQAYERAGAAAISLLTDREFFAGDLRNLPLLKQGVSLPVLRKDFIIDEVQVEESRLFGADAVLLIVRILSEEKLRSLLGLCRDAGMAALTEVHDRRDLERALACGADIVGINNRDLDTFVVRLETTFELAPRVPRETVLVSESGIHGAEDIRALRQRGIHAALVGTALMQSGDPEAKARDLAAAGEARGGGSFLAWISESLRE